LITTLSRADAR